MRTVNLRVRSAMVCVALAGTLAAFVSGAGPVAIDSPDAKVRATVRTAETGRLTISLAREGTAVLDESILGPAIDGADLGDGVTLGELKRTAIDERYPWRGVKAEAINACTAGVLPVTHTASKKEWNLEVRVFNDGCAFRYVVPGTGSRRVAGEKTAFKLPAGTQVWHIPLKGHHEDVFRKKPVDAIPQGFRACLPVTLELPPGGGFAAITEAALFSYGGIALQGTGSTALEAVFTDDAQGFEVEGAVTTPWRVVMTGPTLNALVNSTIVPNLCPPPDAQLFPQGFATPWLRPGRSLWHWWSGSSVAFNDQKPWIDRAAELGFESYLVDEGWSDWKEGARDKWALAKELVDYGRERGIAVWFWKAAPDRNKVPGIFNARERKDFLERCRACGMAGVKIDFMDSSAKKVVEFYTSALAEAAALGLMVNFHGAYEPTGESRTWPNEMTREGILGLEYSIWSTIPLDHYASLPFTRLLAGHGDFTPCTFTPARLKGTTCALQLATAVVYTSPVMHWADKPKVYVQSPALEVIKRIPSVWDETRVLDGSAIGEFAAFARRRGHDWFVGVINAGAARVFELKPAFLGTGYYFAQFHGDKPGEPETITSRQTAATAGQTIPIEIQKGGGFVACFSKLRMVPHGGVFARTQRIRVEAAGRATDIRYTLDGSEPTEASPKYGKRIDLEKSAVVRVKVLGGDGAGAEIGARFIKR